MYQVSWDGVATGHTAPLILLCCNSKRRRLNAPPHHPKPSCNTQHVLSGLERSGIGCTTPLILRNKETMQRNVGHYRKTCDFLHESHNIYRKEAIELYDIPKTISTIRDFAIRMAEDIVEKLPATSWERYDDKLQGVSHQNKNLGPPIP